MVGDFGGGGRASGVEIDHCVVDIDGDLVEEG